MTTPDIQQVGESWRDIPGWEGAYQASDQGRVRSLDRIVARKGQSDYPLSGKVLAHHPNRFGYRIVSLYRGSARSTRAVHRLVLEAFVGAAPEGMECRHLDGNPANNFLQNLSWGTKDENTQDKINHGTHQNTKKTSCKRGHELKAPNLRRHKANLGIRECLACSYAAKWRYEHPDSDKSIKELADQRYRKIMSDGWKLREAPRTVLWEPKP